MTEAQRLESVDILVNMGPQHPSTHGVFRMVLWVDGERVVDCDPHIGYLHRGSEKLSEGELYPQIITLFDRLDYIGNFNTELAFVGVVEKLMNLTVPSAPSTSASSSASSTASPATCSSTAPWASTPAP